MKIVLTGANGFLGRRVLTQLQNRGHSVICIVRTQEAADSLPLTEKDDYIVFDVVRDDPLKINVGCDKVIHLAWGKLLQYNDVDHTELYPQKHFAFLKRFCDLGVEDFAIAGTSFEYGLIEGELDESLECKPVTEYGKGKLALYKKFFDSSKEKSIKIKWLRLFYMYAEDQRKTSLLGQLSQAYMSGQTEFKMSQGDQVRDYLHADAVADAITRTALQENVTGIINIGSGKKTTVLELVERFLEERNATMVLHKGFYPYPTYEPFAFWANVKKLRSVYAES